MLTLLVVGMLALASHIQQVKASGTIYIRADGSVDPDTAPVSSVDNITYSLTDNIVGDVPDGFSAIVVERSNITIDGNEYTLLGNQSGSGFMLENVRNVTIKNIEIKQFVFGIYLNHSSSNSIIENVFNSNSFECIRLYESSNNIIAGNNLILNDVDGITLYGSSNNTMTKNYLMSNYDGIRLYESSNNSITENIVVENYYGISLTSSSDNNIVNNSVTANYGTGISLRWSSNENRMMQNHIASNILRGLCFDESSNNHIYHNNFVDNGEQVNNINSTNIWDDSYPSGGNYWSDYTGQDLDVDGIGDTSYPIDAYNEDRYPLMGPFNAFDAGTWNNIAYCVNVASNSTVSNFYFNPDEGAFLCFNVTGPQGTTGFCRVVIPKELLWVEDGQWTILVGGEPVEYVVIPDENCTYICFTYSHTTKTVEIIGTNVVPEFPTWTPMLLILILLTVAIAIYKRRLLKTPIH